ncbi:MAG: N-formylglutamate amidohydrolase [Defluviitaleaceae bacterium]|nr:N-formylglutamate amidohydrolase [Defluviitaleaceae bacterium]
MKIGLIIHIPHASTLIPVEYKSGFLLSDDALAREVLWSVDAYCDELFDAGIGKRVVAEYNRLVCDPERFRDDALEENAKKGNGFFYTNTLRGLPLRREDPALKHKVLTQIYDKHHEKLTRAVGEALREFGRCLIIDGHSFSDDPYLGEDLPDFCIGTDACHTPLALAETAVDFLRSFGYTVEVNRPFSGSIVPMAYYGKDKRVTTLMIEVNKRLYLEGATLTKSKDFDKIRKVCIQTIKTLMEAM